MPGVGRRLMGWFDGISWSSDLVERFCRVILSSAVWVKGRVGFTVTGDGVLGMREEEEEFEEVKRLLECFDETATMPTTCRLNRLAVYIIDSTQNRHRSWIVFGFVLSPR